MTKTFAFILVSKSQIKFNTYLLGKNELQKKIFLVNKVFSFNGHLN